MTQPPYGPPGPPHYGPPGPPHYGPPPDQQRAKTNLFRAGSVAVWVWVVLSIIPILAVLACCGFCGLGSLGGLIGGAADPSPTP